MSSSLHLVITRSMGLNVRMARVYRYLEGYNSGRVFVRAVGTSVSGEHRRVSSESSSEVDDHR